MVGDFVAIQKRVSDIDATVIPATLGAAVDIKRLEVKQLEAPKRKPADPNKPKKPSKSGAKVAA